MAETIQTKAPTIPIRSLSEVMKEVQAAVALEGINGDFSKNIKDLRWEFDQVSAKMNQAIYNDQVDLIHESCLKTVAVLIKMLART